MQLLIFSLLYAVSAYSALAYLMFPDGITAIWPASGVFLAALLLMPRSQWWLVASSLFIIDFTVETTVGHILLLPAFIFSASLTLQALSGAWLIQRCIPNELHFDNLQDVILFLIVGCILPSAIFAIPPAIASALFLDGNFSTAYWWWAISNGMGILVVTPLLLSAKSDLINSIKSKSNKRRIELFILLAMTIWVTRYAFTTDNPSGATLAPYSYLTIPVLLLIAIRFNSSCTILASFLLACVALWYDGNNIIERGDSLIALQGFLIVVIGGTLLVAALVMERQRALRELRVHRNSLETLIEERTLSLKNACQELESFAYTVSHDLRAPLRSIDGFSRALEEDCEGKLNDTGKHFIARIKANAARMNHIIEDILSLSKVSRSEIKCNDTNLSDIANHIVMQFKENEPKRKVSVYIEDNIRGYCDRKLITIALENLLGNAWKYTSKTDNASIKFYTTQQNGKTVYTVEDNGVGYDMSQANKLFNSFVRLDTAANFEGTGIGLSTVARVITRHNGKVWTEAKMGEGASFHFTIGTDT